MRLKILFQMLMLLAVALAIAMFSQSQAQGATGRLQSTAAATGNPTPSITATPLPTLRADLMGIQAYANLGPQQWAGPNGIIDLASFMGFKWIKIQVSWKELEPTKGQYSPQVDAIVKNVFDAGKRTFKILLSVSKAPDWARPASARGQYDGPPANPQDLIDFLNALYGRLEMSFVQAIEIWNEPNTINEWTGAPLNAAAYLKFFNPVYQSIRAKYPGVVVITAGPAPTGGANGAVNDRQWLQDLYAAGLTKTDPNLAIGAHPYGWANPPDARCCQPANTPPGWNDHPTFFFLDTLNDYRAIMVKNGHSSGKIWATEFGWSTFDGLHFQSHANGPAALPPADPGLGWMNLITETQQAEYIVHAFGLAQTGNLAEFMGPMMLWNMNFSTLPTYIPAPPAPSLPEAGFSLLDSDWHPRPAYQLIQAVPKH